ncbi:hypothetical protein [Flavicella sp.]|uniref:hypothetical protein n=1 Tax=Flavicella sp. TaxID=2957742 RepID=UPI003017B2F4
MLGTPFKQRAHYDFNYKPRYYNQRKERLDNLKDKYTETTDGDSSDNYKITLVRNNLKNNWEKSKKGPSDSGTNKRLAIIIALLVGICAYILEIHTLI